MMLMLAGLTGVAVAAMVFGAGWWSGKRSARARYQEAKLTARLEAWPEIEKARFESDRRLGAEMRAYRKIDLDPKAGCLVTAMFGRN